MGFITCFILTMEPSSLNARKLESMINNINSAPSPVVWISTWTTSMRSPPSAMAPLVLCLDPSAIPRNGPQNGRVLRYFLVEGNENTRKRGQKQEEWQEGFANGVLCFRPVFYTSDGLITVEIGFKFSSVGEFLMSEPLKGIFKGMTLTRLMISFFGGGFLLPTLLNCLLET